MLPTSDASSTPSNSIEESLPVQIGRYRVLGRLGAGGMGIVYKAHDGQLDRAVALKLPHFDGPTLAQELRKKRFQREACAAAQVWHPNVCPIFDVGEHEGCPYVVMGYIEGQSLEERLASSRFEDVSEAIALVRQVLDGLRAVHNCGIIHRDLKPGNILLDPSGRAILTDFGLARPEQPEEPLTSDGAVVGTPSYMAPEQAAGLIDQLGPWTDLYSLGVVLFRMLTGRLPFEGSVATVFAQIIHDEPPSPRVFRPELPPSLEAIVWRALRKRPSERFPDTCSFGTALSGVEITSVTTTDLVPRMQDAPTTSISITRAGYRRPSIARRATWFVGEIFAAAGMSLLAFTVLLLPGGFLPAGAIVFVAPLLLGMSAGLILMGLGVWSLVERAYTAQGLWASARTGLVGWVRSALANGVPVDARDDMGETALIQAAAAGHTEVVKVLLLQGASDQVRSLFGQSAQDAAHAKGHEAVVALLRQPLSRTASVSPQAEVGPAPNAARRLLLATAFGAVLTVVLYILLKPLPQGISYDEFLGRMADGQVKKFTYCSGGNSSTDWLEGELKIPHPMEDGTSGSVGNTSSSPGSPIRPR